MKGNTKKELTQLTMGAAGKDPKALTLFVKVNITVTLQTLKSLALVSGKTLDVFMFYWIQQGGSPSSSSFFVSFFLLEALPTCVIVWPLSACLLRSAVLCSSPHPRPPPPSLAASLRIPTDWLPSSSSPNLPLLSPRPPGQEQLFQNWPTCIKFTTTAAPESVLSNLQLSLCLSPARITLARDGGV